MKRVYVVGTADTKGEELAFIKACVAEAGAQPVLVDVGTRKPSVTVDIAAAEIARFYSDGAEALLSSEDRGFAMKAMGEAFAGFLQSRKDIGGVIGIGGGGGTSVVTTGMQALPVGTPKLMVSTLASGDVGPYVGTTDITMMYSITDMAGLNRVSRVVLRNAAYAIAGMAQAPVVEDTESKPGIGLTMFGVTTPCIMQIVERMKADYDCLVFHATGTGGKAMERLVDNNMLTGVIDATTTEVCDELFGGVLSAGPDRFGAIARTGVPYVGSVGALDMVNFWAPETVPERYAGRTLYYHNPNVTLMRTTADENRQMGQWIAEKLNRCEGQVRFLLPLKGVSVLDAEGKEFFDPEADEALFAALDEHLQQSEQRQLIRLPLHINDPEFSAALVDNFIEIYR
jgi:uncharacterized protein (UPF0261 family)